MDYGIIVVSEKGQRKMAITQVERGYFSEVTITHGDRETATMNGDSIFCAPRKSTAVTLWKYKGGVLMVLYKGSKHYYRYEGVTMAKVFQMMAAESLGAFIAEEIKPNHKVVKTLIGVL